MLLVDVDARLGAERDRGGVGQAIDQPALAEIVVDDQHAARLEAVLDGAERLLGEHVALEPHRGEARLQGQRVDQREHHQVVLLRRGPEEVPRIVGDDVDAGIVVGTVGMVLAPEPHDHRIDLHRVDALRAVQERGGDVGAGAGAEDQHVLEAVAEGRVRPLVEVLLARHRGHRLVEDVVDLDDGLLPFLDGRDLVVRRPGGAPRQPVHDDQRSAQQDDHRQPADQAHRRVDEEHGDGEGDREPRRRRHLEPRHQPERHDPGDAAGQVHAVALERRQPLEQLAHRLGQGGEQHRHDHEHQRQQHRALDDHHRRGGAAREIDAGRGRHRDFEPEVGDHPDYQGLERGVPRRTGSGSGSSGSRRRCPETPRAG